MLFMGVGDTSEYWVAKCHDHLRHAFSILSGLQQMSGEAGFDPDDDMTEVKLIHEKLGKCLGL